MTNIDPKRRRTRAGDQRIEHDAAFKAALARYRRDPVFLFEQIVKNMPKGPKGSGGKAQNADKINDHLLIVHDAHEALKKLGWEIRYVGKKKSR